MAAPLQSLGNPDGSPNKSAIYGLQNDELRAWIEKRLSGDDPYLPLGRSEELPHTLPLQLFQASDPTHLFRERLHHVTRGLLEPILGGRMAPSTPTWLGEILRLAFAIRTKIPRTLLRRAFQSGNFSAGPYGEAGTDIELLDLLANQEGLEPADFWIELIQDPRYALSAFVALERYGMDAVVQGLPTLIATLRGDIGPGTLESRLALPLKRLVEQFGIEQLRPLLETRLVYPDRLIIADALRAVGIPVTFEHGISVAPLPSRDQIMQAIVEPTDREAYGRMPLRVNPIRRGNGQNQPNRML